MKIGLVTACYHPVVNGVTRMVALYDCHLTALGHEVTVFTLGAAGKDGADPNVVRSPGLPLPDGYHFSLGYNREAQARLRQMDVVHCHHLVMGLEFVRRYWNGPIVFTNHTRYDLYAEARFFLPRPLAREVMRQLWPRLTDLADVVVAPSASMRQTLLDFGVRRLIEVIANGMELEAFYSPVRPLAKRDLGLAEAAVLCVYVGRLAPEKSVDTLLAQFALARRLAPELRLLLVGGGPLQGRLELEAMRLGISDCVQFAGMVPPEAVPNYLAAADLFATASVSEVHPLTVIEAMAAALPVVGPAAPGLVDLVESGVSGVLSEDREQGLARALAALAADAEQRRQLGQAARDASRRFDIRNNVAQVAVLYKRLLRARTSVPTGIP